MTRLLVALVILFTSVQVSAVTDRPFPRVNPAVPLPASFRFTVFGDFRSARADEPYPRQFRQALDAMKSEKPAFAVSVGDAWYGYGGTFDHYRNEVGQFLAIVQGWDVPLFNTIGNHEVTGKLEREEYLSRKIGNLYGSFDFGDVHFVFLDTDEVGKEGRIAGSQRAWLERDLKQNGGASAIMVFLHRPLFSPNDQDLSEKRSFIDRQNRDDLHRLFVRYGVSAVFAGHEHLYDERAVDGISYYITGGGGAPLYAAPDKGGFYHFLLVTVTGKKVKVEVRKL